MAEICGCKVRKIAKELRRAGERWDEQVEIKFCALHSPAGAAAALELLRTLPREPEAFVEWDAKRVKLLGGK